MKKTFLLIAAVGLALASCTSDEPESADKGYAIDFRPAIGSRSRAVETTNANLTSINVTAFVGTSPLFSKLDFNKDADDYFTSTPEYYWPGDDSEVTFYALAPAAPGGTVTITNDTKNIADFSPAPKMADQVDLITSTATGKKSLNEARGMNLTFDHQLSQIEVRAKTDNTAYKFEVTGVRIGEPVSKGTFDFGTTAWTLGSDKSIYEETYSTPITLNSVPATIMGEGGNAILIPQQLVKWDPENDAANTAAGAYLSVQVKISTAETGTVVYPFPSEPGCTWAAIPIDTNWEAGKKYIYNLDFTHGAGNVDPKDPDPGKPVLGGPIFFTVDVVDWNEADIDLPMNPA